MTNLSIVQIPTIGIWAFCLIIAEPLSTYLKGLQEPYIVTASMAIITMILVYRIYLNIISYISDYAILKINEFKQKKNTKVIPIAINQIGKLFNEKCFTIIDLEKVGDIYKETNNNIEEDELTNNNNNLKELSDFEIAINKIKEDKKEESEKVRTAITKFVLAKFADMGIEEEEEANSFIEEIYKYNELHNPQLIVGIKVKINRPHKKLAEIAHYAGKLLKWSGHDIAIFTKNAFKCNFKNWEVESIKRIASSKLANKKDKK